MRKFRVITKIIFMGVIKCSWCVLLVLVSHFYQTTTPDIIYPLSKSVVTGLYKYVVVTGLYKYLVVTELLVYIGLWTYSTHRLSIFKQGHVITTQSTDKQDCSNIIKTRDPFSSL